MAGTAGITAGRAYVRLGLDSSEFVKGLRTAETKLRDFGNRVGSLGASFAGMAAAAAAPIALSAKTFAAFEDQMLAVQAVSQSTREEFTKLYAQAKQLGATTSFTAVQVASGQLNLARQGFRPAEIEAAIPSVLNLARATGTDLALAADIASGTLRAFNMQASEMPRVADVLVATANNSAQTIEDLGESMKYVAPVAYQYGLSLEQTSKALGVLANMQIKGTMAGTSLRQIMLQLADPGTQKRLRELGVNTVDAAGNMRPLGDVMVEIGNAMAKMGGAARLTLGKELFDQRAVSAGLTLATQDFDGLSTAIENAAGVADRTAKTMDSGIGGMFRILMSAVEGVQIAIGETLTETLTSWGTTATDVATATNAWVKENKELIVAFTAVVAAVGAAGVALIAFGAAANGAAAMIGATTLAVKGLSASMTLLSANPVFVTIAAFVAAYKALGYVIDSAEESAIRDYFALDKLSGAQVSATASAKDLRKALNERMETMQRIADATQDVAKSMMTGSKKESMITELTRELEKAKAEAKALLDRLREIRDQKPAGAITEEPVDLEPMMTGKELEDFEKRVKERKDKQEQEQKDFEAFQTQAAQNTQSLADQTRRQEIENTYRNQLPGDQAARARLDHEKQVALLELERQQMYRDSAETGIGKPEIDKYIAAQRASADFDYADALAGSAKRSEGTYSAMDAFRLGAGPSAAPDEETAKNTKKIAKDGEEQNNKLQTLIDIAKQGGKMGS